MVAKNGKQLKPAPRTDVAILLQITFWEWKQCFSLGLTIM